MVGEAEAPAGSLFPASIGERLRAAREAAGLNLEDVSVQTKVPVRHLEAIERGSLDSLPAAPYSAGFVKAYARTVGLDPMELSRAFRSEMDRADIRRPDPAPFEPADPKRLPPPLLAIAAALIAVILVAGYALWRSGTFGGDTAETRGRLAAGTAPETTPAAPGATALPAPAAAPASSGNAVVLTAREPVWLRVYERGGATLYQGELAAGGSYAVPATAADPLIRLGRPEALDVTVGGRPVAPLGPPARTISNVSLNPQALLARGTAAPPSTSATPSAATPPRRTPIVAPPPAPEAPAPAPVEPAAGEPAADQPGLPPAFRP